MESLKQLKETRQKLKIPLIVLSAGNKDHYQTAVIKNKRRNISLYEKRILLQETCTRKIINHI